MIRESIPFQVPKSEYGDSREALHAAMSIIAGMTERSHAAASATVGDCRTAGAIAAGGDIQKRAIISAAVQIMFSLSNEMGITPFNFIDGLANGAACIIGQVPDYRERQAATDVLVSQILGYVDRYAEQLHPKGRPDA